LDSLGDPLSYFIALALEALVLSTLSGACLLPMRLIPCGLCSLHTGIMLTQPLFGLFETLLQRSYCLVRIKMTSPKLFQPEGKLGVLSNCLLCMITLELAVLQSLFQEIQRMSCLCRLFGFVLCTGQPYPLVAQPRH